MPNELRMTAAENNTKKLKLENKSDKRMAAKVYHNFFIPSYGN